MFFFSFWDRLFISDRLKKKMKILCSGMKIGSWKKIVDTVQTRKKLALGLFNILRN
jgi:hypothetical protein